MSAIATGTSTLVESPVQQCYGHFRDLKHWTRRYAPFTYMAYHSIIPSHEDDLISVASKVADCITFRFFIQFCAAAVHPASVIIPFVPLALDLVWISYHWIRGHQIAPLKNEVDSAPTRSSDRIRSLFLLALSLGGIVYLNRVLPPSLS